MDTLTVEARSERMSRIRSKDTKPELRVRRLLHRLGYRYRLHRKGLAGNPDLVFPSRSKVVFVHGCFWHAHEGCKIANQPKSRQAYWEEKFARNRDRDARNEAVLCNQGWGVHTIWECEVKDDTAMAARLLDFLGPPRNSSVLTPMQKRETETAS